MKDTQQLLDDLLYSVQEYNKDNPATLTHIIDILEDISKKASLEEHLSLNNLALLLQDNLLCIYEDSQSLSIQQYDLLKVWPQLFDNYVNQFEIEHTINLIVKNLSNDSWPIPVVDKDAEILQELLNTEIQQQPIKENINQEELLSNTFTTLITTVEKIIDKDSIIIQDFSQKIKKLTETAELSGFIGFHDLCLMALENLTELSTLNKITDTHKTLITSWFSLAQKYLQSPEKKEYCQGLISNLSNQHWPLPIPKEDRVTLFDILGLDQEDDVSEKSFELSFSQLLSKLFNLVNSINESVNRKTEINNTIDKLIEQSSTENLLGLQDVFLFYQEGLDNFANTTSNLSYEDIQFLAQLPTLIKIYYSSPKNKTTISQLIQYLQHPNWNNSINIEDAELLKNILTNVNEDTGIHTFHGNFLSEAIEKNNITSNINLAIQTDNQQNAISLELVEMLAGEITDSLNNKSSIIPTYPADSEHVVEHLTKYITKLDRFANASQAADLSGLFECCNLFIENLNDVITNPSNYKQKHEILLSTWLNSLANYLVDLGSEKNVSEIIDILKNPVWNEIINEEQGTLLSDLLSKPYILTDEKPTATRITHATERDINIDIDDDINIDLLEGLLEELPGQTSQLSNYIQNLTSQSPDFSAIEKAQRVAHTIKGAANTVGIRGVAVLTHQLEDILLLLNSNNQIPNKKLGDDLMTACDCLEEMTEALMQRSPAPSYAKDVLQNILDWVNLIEESGIEVVKQEQDDIKHKPHTESSNTIDEEEVKPKSKDSAQGLTINLPVSTIDNFLRLMGESMILNLQLHEKIQYANTQTQNLKSRNSVIQDLCSDLERQIELEGSALSTQQAINQSEVFDPLELEQYNDLHTTSNRIVESSSDAHEINTDIEGELKTLNDLIYNQSNIQSEIYDLMMQSRMLPFERIIARLQRTIRQTCRTLGKDVKLKVYGEDTLIDRNILANITDPLMHMVRNSIDHGIEPADERINNNKDAYGTIIISIVREGTLIHITLEDDGVGINKDRIREVAVNRGILNSNSEYSESELYDLLFQPGFSTREKSTQTSGRGIGMDIVKEQIMSMNGRISITSVENKGSKFDIFLPISLITSHAIFTSHENRDIALSNYNVMQILHPTDWEIIVENGLQKILFENQVLDFYTIEYILNTTNDNTIRNDSNRPALLITHDNKQAIIFLHSIMDSKNIVIKDTGVYLQKIQGMLGATISGDGSVVPVLDISELIRTSSLSNTSTTISMAQTSIIQMLPLVMIVDDSISTRRALSQLMKDAGYETITAKDGLEAIGLLDKRLPSIMLIDFEMPRMNGIELATHIRGSSSFEKIPMIMITSRATDKHKNLAFETGINSYFVKPFSEDKLLDEVAHFIDTHNPL